MGSDEKHMHTFLNNSREISIILATAFTTSSYARSLKKSGSLANVAVNASGDASGRILFTTIGNRQITNLCIPAVESAVDITCYTANKVMRQVAYTAKR